MPPSTSTVNRFLFKSFIATIIILPLFDSPARPFPTSTARTLTMISAIVPARDEEASIARVVESLEAQPEESEIIVVNDGSTDRTGSILAELALRIPLLRVLETGDLPDGWIGKNYAVTVGARAAR